MTEGGTPCAHCLAPAADGKTFRTLYGNCLHLCPACWEAADKRKASDFDTTNDTLFEGMQIAVEAALREDVDDPPLAVTRAVFAFLQAHFSQTNGFKGNGTMTGEQLLVYLQQMTHEERAAPIMVHVQDEETGAELYGAPYRVWHEFDCDDNGILRLTVLTQEPRKGDNL